MFFLQLDFSHHLDPGHRIGLSVSQTFTRLIGIPTSLATVTFPDRPRHPRKKSDPEEQWSLQPKRNQNEASQNVKTNQTTVGSTINLQLDQRHAPPIYNAAEDQLQPHHGASHPHHLHVRPTPRKCYPLATFHRFLFS